MEEEEKQEILVMNNKNMFNRCWLHLPHEILELIMKRLFYADLLNFRLVCKSWNSSINNRGGGGVTVPLKQSPWLLMFDRIKFTSQPPPRASATYCEMVRKWKKTSKACSCKLFDPVYKKTYTINNMSNNINVNLFLIEHVYASKHGWILVLSSDHIGVIGGHYSSFFYAYTPFSTVNNFIELPALESCGLVQLATFTSNPSLMDKEDCLFVVLHNPSRGAANNYVHEAVIISTCRLGEKSWSRQYLKYSVPVFEFNSYNVSGDKRWVYSEGNIYYMIHLGKQLGQTRVVKWELVRVVKWELIMKSGSHEEEEEHHELYGSVMNKELDDDLLSKLEKDHFSILNYFAQPLRTAGTEYESCHTESNRKMVKIDPPHY